MSIDRCKCPLCAALPANPTLTARDAAGAGYATNTAVDTWIPEPRVTVVEQTIFDLVKADLDGRDKIGAAQHGSGPFLANICQCGHPRSDHGTGGCGPMFADSLINCPCNDYRGRDWLREAYEETLDLCAYLRWALEERKDKK